MADVAKWRKFTRQEIEEFVKESRSFIELAGKIGCNTKAGSYSKNVRSMVDELELDTSHFIGQSWNKGRYDYERFRKGNAIKISAALNALVALRGHKCEGCGLECWFDKPIRLEVHHIDGDSLNNELNNLQLLCPNCHSLTASFRGRNINSGHKIVSDEVLLNSLRENKNIRQALKSVGLTAKGGNYQRARDLIYSNNITHLM